MNKGRDNNGRFQREHKESIETKIKRMYSLQESLMPLHTNHKVVSINFIDDVEDVYDIEVKDNHNFALASGVFVHNSKDQADAVCGAL